MVALSSYWASVGIKTDEKDIKKVDEFLNKIEARLSKFGGLTKLRINPFIDEAKLNKHIRGVLDRAGKANPFKISNVTIDPNTFTRSIRDTLAKSTFRAPITAVLSRNSLATLRAQVSTALQGLPINVRVGATRATSGTTGSVSQARRNSLTGRGDPSLQEFLMGRPEKSSLSAGNRRYVDAILNKSLGGVGGNSLSGLAVQGGLGSLARKGSASLLGRIGGMAGMALGGPLGGTAAMVGGGILSLAGEAFTGIWSTLGKVITLPFQAVSSAASAVTSAFYKVALAAVPLVAGFGLINKNVQQQKSREVALNTISKSFGSDGSTESKWLMNMSNREGMRYDTLIDPFTSFIASSAPSMGLEGAKNIFEAFTQFGLTRGADDESMKRAMVAVSQMSGKGKVGAEELRQQLGDARGFGEMQSIFAEAYQRSLGRQGDAVKKGQPAIEELGNEMKKGNVYASKVLPYVAEIAKRMAEPGLAEARGASFAEQNRFMNQLTEGWMNFSKGGGEQGIAYFWQMMQGFGDWWKSNGSILGRYFHATVVGLDALRLSIKETWQFLTTGQHNSITDWARSVGIDVDKIRDALLRLRDAIMKLLGINSDNVGTILETIIDRLIKFINQLQGIADGAIRAVNGVEQVKQATVVKNEKYNQAGFWEKTFTLSGEAFRNIMDFTPFGKIYNADRPTVMGGLSEIVGGTKDATTAATSALYNLATGSGGKPQSLAPAVRPWNGASETVGSYSQTPTMTTIQRNTSQKVDVNMKVSIDGNADIMAMIDKPMFYSKMAETAESVFSRKLSTEMSSAPDGP